MKAHCELKRVPASPKGAVMSEKPKRKNTPSPRKRAGIHFEIDLISQPVTICLSICLLASLCIPQAFYTDRYLNKSLFPGFCTGKAYGCELEKKAVFASHDSTSPLVNQDEAAVEIPEVSEVAEPEQEAATELLYEVPCLLQNPELPTGCESVALTNTLLYHGFDLEKTTIADEWLPMSDTDFVNAFLGNPHDAYSNSCMAPAITQTANAYLANQGSHLKAEDLSGISMDEVLHIVEEEGPVIVWSSIDLLPVGEPYLTQIVNEIEYGLYQNSHCVVISGYDLVAGIVYVSDSLAGKTSYDMETFTERYYALGSQAVIIR